MEDKVLYRKKFRHGEMTISKTTWKEKIEAVFGVIILAFVIWYFTR